MSTLALMDQSDEDLQELCESALADLREEICCVWNAARQKYASMEHEGILHPPHYGFVSYIRTGVLTTHAWFQIDIKDVRGWADITDCTEDWWVKPIIQQLDFSPVQSRIGNKYDEESSIALEKKALAFADQLYAILAANRQYLFNKLKKQNPNMNYAIGEYMGTYLHV